MFALLISSVLIAAGDHPLETNTQYTFRGKLVAEQEDPTYPPKSFQLVLLSATDEQEQPVIYWTLEESGGGAWSWPDRFGVWKLDHRGRTLGIGPALLSKRVDGASTVDLPSMVAIFDESPAAGLTWREGRTELRVLGGGRSVDRNTWIVEGSDPVGRKTRLHIDKQSPLIVSQQRTIFIGRGVRHELRLTLAKQKPISPENVENAKLAFSRWADLRIALKHQPRSASPEWESAQLQQLASALPAATTAAKETPLARVASAANRDFKSQRERAGAIGAMKRKRLGQPFGKLALAETNGATIDLKDLTGAVTVLHFWEYRDTPLEEPYGQTAYLDFLFRRHGDAGVRVYGVSVDSRLRNPTTRRRGLYAAKKFKAFMNLSYPILLDDGKLLDRLGDPRAAGGRLPLYMVIDRSGKIVHYHAGLHEVDRDLGLIELEKAVKQAARASE